ncbi:hypothetical protein IWQ62_002985 [Dispira parvispora]|uniref:Cyclopropane-fatty-acyl-phospholipid synthase n=1 Tax=Dispira parvispora TaxID=1520584 RepID=A0A9W8E6Y5_9FUNG|nr:hypothetical protein IWQ62_002985 [Dispira parvispora]
MANTRDPVRILSLLKNVKRGELTIVENHEQHQFGHSGKDIPRVTIQVHHDRFWVRVALRNDLGFAEAYMDQDIDVDNLVAFITLFLVNRNELANGDVGPSWVTQLLNRWRTSYLANTITNAVYNVRAHYDLDEKLFSSFLDPTWTYSCAIWRNPDDTLEQAQVRKLESVIAKARLTAQDHVLDLGCGWGSFALMAAQRIGCQVTCVTLSSQQWSAVVTRVRKAGVAKLVQVLLCDYRCLDPQVYQFDKIVSVEMVEAVGAEFLATFFRCCHQLLHPQHGLLVLQGIVMPEAHYAEYHQSVDFIRQYIFPGGECPTITSLVQAATEGSEGQLVVDHLENLPWHYAKTLRMWRQSFNDNFPALATLTAASFPAQKQDCYRPIYDESFRRKWDYYFSYCEAGFDTRTLGVVQMVFTRIANPRLLVS